jgi:hypothetical protein
MTKLYGIANRLTHSKKANPLPKNTLTKKVVGKKFTILAQSYFIIHLKMKNKMNGGLNLSLHLTTGG